MTSLVLLLLLTSVHLKNCQSISTAISDIINKFYSASDANFDIIIYDDEFRTFNSVIERLFKRNSNLSKFRVVKIDQENSWEPNLHESAILLFGSFKLLEKFNSEVEFSNTYAKKINLLTYCRGATMTNLLGINKTSVITHQSFLIEGRARIDLATFMMFTPRACNRHQLIIVNRYSKKTSSWATKEFFPRKFDKFHGCELVIAVNHQAPALAYELHPNGSLDKVWGYNAIIIQNIAEKLNFTITYNPYFFLNNSYLNSTMINDYRMFSAPLQSIVLGEWFISETYFTTSTMFLIPLGRLYSSFEKLFLPFDAETWIAIVAFYSIGLIVIIVIKKSSKKLQNFVFGDKVTTPILNLVIHSFGGVQSILPRFNFSRYILTLFVLFSLIIR